jgi:hypothetical protein
VPALPIAAPAETPIKKHVPGNHSLSAKVAAAGEDSDVSLGRRCLEALD